MNVARSTLVRKGYLLTALTVAVLLVVSSGTAWAQTIGFRQSRATLAEEASTDAATPVPLKVTITRSGNFDRPDGEDEGTAPDQTFAEFIAATAEHLALEVVEYDGRPHTSGTVPFTITARSGDTGSWTITPLTTGGTVAGAFGFGADTSRTTDMVATTIELTISNSDPDDGDWNPETLVLKLHAVPAFSTHLTSTDTGATTRNVRFGTRQLTVTVEDDDPMPKLKFSPAGIQLAEGNMLKMTAGVGVGAGGRGSLPTGDESIRATLAGFTGAREDVLLSVSPPDAVGTLIQVWKDADDDGVLDAGEGIQPDGQGSYNIGKIGDDGTTDGAVGATTATENDGIELTIKAIDVSGFRDERITFTLMDGRTEAQMASRGGIDDSDPATVTVLSGEETPTVTFSKESVSIDEGGMETVHILADGAQGDQVGSVTVSVSGDATIVLEQGGSQISGGTVEFGSSANAELTIRALPDARLEDGEEKMATVTITDASGANIGDPRSLTVTVVGATNVPVLPLVGQLILALLLTAGGARLYRRRQQ